MACTWMVFSTIGLYLTFLINRHFSIHVYRKIIVFNLYLSFDVSILRFSIFL